MNHDGKYANLSREEKSILIESICELPLSISSNAIFTGSQIDYFIKSYALINLAFEVESFGGFCAPTAVYNGIEPNEEFSHERIEKVRKYDRNSNYVKTLNKTYEGAIPFTDKVAFCVEEITGHFIPDFRYALKNGLDQMIEDIQQKLSATEYENKKLNYRAMITTLESTIILANHYAAIASVQAQNAAKKAKERLLTMKSYNITFFFPE